MPPPEVHPGWYSTAASRFGHYLTGDCPRSGTVRRRAGGRPPTTLQPRHSTLSALHPACLMSTFRPQIPLPPDWPELAKTGINQPVALTHLGLTHIRGWCLVCPHPCVPRRGGLARSAEPGWKGRLRPPDLPQTPCSHTPRAEGGAGDAGCRRCGVCSAREGEVGAGRCLRPAAWWMPGPEVSALQLGLHPSFSGLAHAEGWQERDSFA